MLTLVDDYTRECPVIEVDTSLGGLRVCRVLDRVAAEQGLPEAIVLDNGPEFRSRALAAWSEAVDAVFMFYRAPTPRLFTVTVMVPEVPTFPAAS